MSLQCIGKKRDVRGIITRCDNVSDVPNDSRWPDTYLCLKCSMASPNRPYRPQYEAETPDIDHPNYEFNENPDGFSEDRVTEILENEETDILQEMDII